MIEIKNIYITEKGDKLIIDANIVLDSLFKSCYIKKIFIDTQDTYTMTGPSEKLAYELDITEIDADKFVPNSTFELDGKTVVRNIHVVIPEEDICANLKSDFLIVYVQSDGEFDKSLISKCCSPTLALGCVFWTQPLYRDFLGFIRELNESCDVPRNFIYKYLQFQALLVAARTCNINEAIFFFKKYIRHIHHHPEHHHGHVCVTCHHDDHHHDHHDHHDCHHHDHHHKDNEHHDCHCKDHHHDHEHHHNEHHHDHDIHDHYYQGFEPNNYIHVEHHSCNCHGGNNFSRH